MKLLSSQPIRFKALRLTSNNCCSCRSVRKLSSLPSFDNKPIQVVVSKSNCPFENLAFEDYVYENISFDKNERLLFLWRNGPSVVIGRHQNPWLEVNMALASMRNVAVSRRQSGGGTVYHDLGNMNLTFFTDRKSYDRKKNLEYIIKTLSDAYGLDLMYNKKDDILFNGKFKVSGSAAKLGLKTAYHHCTLLCNTDMTSISKLLTHTFGEVETNATKSCPSPTANLFNESYNFSTLCNLLADSFHCIYSQLSSKSDIVLIDPLEFDSVAGKVEKLKDWQWIYQKTPAFTTSNYVKFNDGQEYEIRIHIKKGVIKKTELIPDSSNDTGIILKFLLSRLMNHRFYYDDFVSILLSENEENGFNIAQVR